MKLHSYLISTILLVAIACSYPSDISSILSQAETLMTNHPDSSLHLLEQLSPDQQYTSEQSAKYALLFTKALHKNYRTIPTDSLINIALHYYSKKEDKNTLAEVYFYKGVISEEKSEIEQAFKYYKQSETYIVKSNNTHLRALIYEYIGGIYSNANLSTEAIKYYEKALEQAKLIYNATSIVSNIKHLAIEYLYLNQTEKACTLLQSCLTYLPMLSLQQQGAVYHNLGRFYVDYYPNDSLGVHYLHKAIDLLDTQKRIRSYSALATYYSQTAKKEQADSLWNTAMRTADHYTQAAIYHSRFLLNEKEENYKEALFFFKRHTILADSLKQVTNSSAIAKIQAQYDVAIIQKKYSQACLAFGVAVLFLLILFTIHQRRKWMDERKLNRHIAENEKHVRELQSQFTHIRQNQTKSHEQEIIQINDALTKQLKITKNLEQRSRETKNAHSEALSYYQSALSGMRHYISIIQNNEISQLDTKELRNFIDCYKQTDNHFFEWLKKKNVNLTPRETVICILHRMGKNKQEIINLLRCSDGTYRTSKTRIKTEFKPDSDYFEIEKYIQKLL